MLPKSSIENIKNLMEKRTQLQGSWLQHILLMSSSLFGILIALHGRGSDIPYIRWVFALAVSVLALGILLETISLYSQISDLKRLQVDYVAEVLAALRECRDEQPVLTSPRIIFAICEKVGYICLSLSVLLLALYAVLLAVY